MEQRFDPLRLLGRAAQQKIDRSANELNVAVFFSGDVRNQIIIGAQLLPTTEVERLEGVVQVDISPNLPPSSSWTHEAALASGPSGVGRDIANLSNRCIRRREGLLNPMLWIRPEMGELMGG